MSTYRTWLLNLPKLVQGVYQKEEDPSPNLKSKPGRKTAFAFTTEFQTMDPWLFGISIKGLSPTYLCFDNLTHSLSVLLWMSQTNFPNMDVFASRALRMPKPPSLRGRVTLSHPTRWIPLSELPFQRKRLEALSICSQN